MLNFRAALISGFLASLAFGSSIQQTASGGGTPVISVIQQHGNTAAGSTTSLAVTISAAAAGNILAVFVTNQSSTITVTGITCTNTTFVRIGGDSSIQDTEIWIGTVAGGSSGTTVTAAFTAGNSSRGILAAEFNSTLGFSSADLPGTGSGGVGTTATTGTFTRALAPELVLVVVGFSGAGGTPGSPTGAGYTDLTIVNGLNDNIFASYRNAGFNGPISATWALGGSIAWGTGIGGIQATSGAVSFSDVSSLSWVKQ